MRYLLVGLCVLACMGCVTERDKVAVVRAAKFAAQEGSELGLAVSDELCEVAADIGADKIDPATVPLTVEAAKSNAAGIKREREMRVAILGFVKGLASKWGPTAAILSMVTAGAGLFMKLREKAKILRTVVEGVESSGIGKEVLDVVKAKVKSLAVDYGVQPALDKVVQDVTAEE